MTLEYAVCPHCGCRCEDDEYCAACGKLFHEDTGPARNVSVLGVLGSGLRSLARSVKPEGNDDIEIEEDLEFCPSWSFLSNNVHNEDLD